MHIYYISIMLLALLSGCTSPTYPKLPTVESVDLDRYLGRWIEIARYENHFEKGCVGATADYERKEDYVGVTNRCLDENGVQTAIAYGRAYPVDGSQNAKLRVSFFRPFYGDYWVLKLGENYEYSLIGDPKRKYLWILARTKTLSEKDKRSILDVLPSLGYDPSLLYWTK